MSDGEINVDSIDGEVLTTANIVGQLYPQGEKGDKGDRGDDGFSPTVTTEKVGKTTTITITDAEGEHTATILDGADGQGSGDMRTEVYDINQNGIVDDAEKVNGHTVGTDVPADAVFTDTTYTAGTGIDITGNVITNTQTSAEWGNITGTLTDQTDLKNALDSKANTSAIPTKVSDLTNDSGFIDKDVNNLTNYDTSTTVDTKISNSEEVLIGSDSGIKASHELWIDTNDVTPYVNSEISNDYGTAQNLGYSQEYVNGQIGALSNLTTTAKTNVVSAINELDAQDKIKVGKLVDSNYRVNFLKGKNLLNVSALQTDTIDSITFKPNSNGTITINGTRASTTKFYYYLTGSYWTYDSDLFSLPSGTYTYSCANLTSDCKLYITIYYLDGTYKTRILDNSTTSATLTFDELVKMNIRIEVSGTSYSNLVLSPMIERGSTATTYENYITPSINIDGDEIYSQNNLGKYSTSGIRIGTWIDGKPIYRKVVSTTCPSSINTETTVGSIGAFDTLVSLQGNVYLNETYGVVPVPQAFTSNYITMYMKNKASGDIRMSIQNSFYTSKPLIIVLEYTKTTN